MKATNTQDELSKVKTIIEASGAKLFQQSSMYPKDDAQRNLSGRTHYVDSDTLKYFGCKIAETHVLFGGLVYAIIQSDKHPTAGRIYRFTVFDVWGDTIERQDLDGAFKTVKQARKAFDAFELDVRSHYRDALFSKQKYAKRDFEALRQAYASLI